MKYRCLENCYFHSHFGGANSILLSKKNLCIPCIPCEKFQASTLSIMFFCQNYRPTEICVLQTPRKSAPSAWNKKSPLVVPNTSRPLRENKNMFFCPKKICEFREFCVKIKICSSCQKQSSSENQEFFVDPPTSSQKSKSHASILSIFFANSGSGC